jgi:hypothetical protein
MNSESVDLTVVADARKRLFNCVKHEVSAHRVVTHQPTMRRAQRVGAHDFIPAHAAKPLLTHQSFNRVADYRDTFTVHLLPDLVGAR